MMKSFYPDFIFQFLSIFPSNLLLQHLYQLQSCSETQLTFIARITTMETLSHQDHHHHHNNTFPEKMAMIRLNSTELDDDILSDAGTIDAHRSSGLTRSGSLRSYRRQSSLLRSSSRLESSSYAKHSAELTAQAESKFLILMDVISNASKEASSLKAVWENMKHERELLLQKHEALVTQTTELTAELRTREDERSRSSTDVVDWKRKVEKLLTDLAASQASVTTEKAHVQERDKDIEKIRTELREVRDSGFRKDSQSERELETLRARLKQSESERDIAIQASEKYHRDLNKAVRERSELTSKLNEVTTSHETTQKDVLSLTGRLKIVEAERETSLQTVVRLKEELTRIKQKSAEDSRDAIEATERYEKLTRETARLKETLGVIEVERDDHLRTIETLRRQSKAQKLDHDELTTRFADVSRDHEATRREIITIQENLKTSELSRDKHIKTLERTRESLHSITRQRDELADELSTVTKRLDEHRQQSTLTRESLTKAEEKVSELHVEVSAVNEKVVYIQRERDDARSKVAHNLTEINQLEERIAILEHQKGDIIQSRTKLSAELEQLRSEYSQVTETITSFHNDTEDMEQEIESLRALVHEAQEQRERAISARESADRERDTYVSRYEEKCREIERLRESTLSRSGSYSHAHARSSRGGAEFRTTRTITSRSVSHLDQGSTHENGFSNLSGIDHVSNVETPMETSVAA
jgi:chromosome segregation ATPase